MVEELYCPKCGEDLTVEEDHTDIGIDHYTMKCSKDHKWGVIINHQAGEIILKEVGNMEPRF